MTAAAAELGATCEVTKLSVGVVLPDDDESDLGQTQMYRVDADDLAATCVRNVCNDEPGWGEKTEIFDGERLSAIQAAIDEAVSSMPPLAPATAPRPLDQAQLIDLRAPAAAPPAPSPVAQMPVAQMPVAQMNACYLPPSGDPTTRVSDRARRMLAATIVSLVTIMGLAAAATAVLVSI